MRVIAVIPARGGSKSIPRKNIKLLLGHPLVAFSIAAAQKCRLVDRIICSTDDEEIASVARQYGAEVPFMRPSAISRDETTDFPVFEHLISTFEDSLDHEDILIHLRPTSPFRPPELLELGIRTMIQDQIADSVRSISISSQNPYKMWTIEDGVLQPLIRTTSIESYNMPRQLLPETFWHNGLLDIVRVGCIRSKKSISGDRILPLVVAPDYAIDLDTLHEWNVAQKIMETTKLPFVKPD